MIYHDSMYKNKFRQNVAALVKHKDLYLVCRRNDHQIWQSVQGGIESFDQSPRDALIREMYEELGVQENDFKILYQSSFWRRYLFTHKTAKMRHHDYDGQDQLWFLVELNNKNVFDFDIVTKEFSELDWVSLPELLNRYATWKKAPVYDFCREINLNVNQFCETFQIQ